MQKKENKKDKIIKNIAYRNKKNSKNIIVGNGITQKKETSIK